VTFRPLAIVVVHLSVTSAKHRSYVQEIFQKDTTPQTRGMATTALLAEDGDILTATTQGFRLSLAKTMEDLRECQRLRYLVFNCELGEGLSDSEGPGLNQDRFDLICDHLMVRDLVAGRLAGTYRMQSGYRAKGNLGYYSEQLFDFEPLEVIRSEVVELGRACVHAEYRNTTALSMLWKGIASYASLGRARYLVGAVR
jgi:putative hemolysin